MAESEFPEVPAGPVPAGTGGEYPEFARARFEGADQQSPPVTAVSERAGTEGAGLEGTGLDRAALEETGPQPAYVPGLELLSDPAAAPVIPTQPAAPSAPRGSRPRRARLAFRAWRRSRPFWGGLFVVLGGGEILFSEKAPLRVIVHFGLTGLAGYLIPAVMVLCGVLLVFNPAQRMFYSILSVLLALATWPTSNLGGFLIGMFFGLIGGSLAFAWMPLAQMPKPKAPKREPPKAAAEG